MNLRAVAHDGAGLPTHEKVYRRLRDKVLYGDLAPGQPVTIQGLVEDLGVGMTPVREALRRLTAEGALQALGNRRIVVPELTADAVTQITGARTALESQLAHKAVEHASPAQIDDLVRIDLRLDDAITNGDIPGYLRENHAFHIGLYQIANAPIVEALVMSLWLRFGPSLRVVCGQFGTRNLPDRHKELIAALRKGDGDAAALAMKEDVVQGMAQIMKGITQG